MSSLKGKIRVLALAAGAVLIGAQWLLGTIPPWLGYSMLAIFGGGAIFLEFERIYDGISRTWANDPEKGKQSLIIHIILIVVIGGLGLLFIRS